jgi:hypothetical protein
MNGDKSADFEQKSLFVFGKGLAKSLGIDQRRGTKIACGSNSKPHPVNYPEENNGWDRNKANDKYAADKGVRVQGKKVDHETDEEGNNDETDSVEEHPTQDGEELGKISDNFFHAKIIFPPKLARTKDGTGCAAGR